MIAPNLDDNEISKFAAQAARWWDPEGDARPLHAINPLRLNWINERVSLHQKKILDVGCGGGILAESMARRGGEVLGIDMAAPLLEVAKQHATEHNVPVNYQQAMVEEMVIKHAASFDVVTCLEMLEHTPNPQSVIAACCALLKPTGALFLSTINRTLASYVQAIIAAERILRLLPPGTHEYQKFIKPSELSQYLRQARFDISAITGMSYNPLSKNYFLTTKVGVNYLCHARKNFA